MNTDEKTIETDNSDFVVNQKEYEKFLAALEEPPKSIPALRKLFSEPSVLEG